MEKVPYAMSVEDFSEHLEKRKKYDEHFDYDKLIVRMMQKEYDIWSKKDVFITFNIILEYDINEDGWVWEWDWNEGQETYILGYIEFKKIQVPSFAQILK